MMRSQTVYAICLFSCRSLEEERHLECYYIDLDGSISVNQKNAMNVRCVCLGFFLDEGKII